MKPRDAWADKLRCIWRTLPSGFSRATEVWFGREVGPSRIGKYLQVVAERVFGVVVGEGFAKVGVEFRPFELEIELLLLAKEGVHVDGFGDDRRCRRLISGNPRNDGAAVGPPICCAKTGDGALQ